MERHAKKCVERYCELANKTIEQLYKVSTPYLGDHQSKKEELEAVGPRLEGIPALNLWDTVIEVFKTFWQG